MPDITPTLPPVHGRTTPQAPPTLAPPDWDLSHIEFSDVLSALNPLQYVPVVGTIYRELTGDEVHPALRVAVGTAMSVFLGPVGLAATLIGVAVSEVAHGGPTATPGRWAEASDAYRRAGRAA